MVELGTLIHPAKYVRCGDGEYPVLSMTMHDGLVFQDDKFKKVIASKDRSGYKVVYRNQLVISFPIDEGVLAAQRIVDAGIVSPAYGIWDIDQTQVLPEFLEYSLRCERALDYYKAKLRGSTARRRSLPTPTLLAFSVPLPEIKEQQQILEIIHHVKATCGLRQQELQKLDDLVKARFVELFGDPIINSKHLETKDLKDVLILKAGDFTAASDIADEPSEVTPYPCYGGNGIRGYVSEYNQEGEYSLIGRQGALSGNVQFASGKFKNTEHALLVTPIVEMNNIWLNQLLLNLDLKRYQTGAAQPGLSVKNLQEIQIICVPIDEQNQYAEFVKQTDKSKSATFASPSHYYVLHPYIGFTNNFRRKQS
ncbi:MAG: restriction endonuclease subunit S [Lachnospiraceae bacterium]|nr:restriction endonuclease subunit S [Lachnospiraceae bacterium]